MDEETKDTRPALEATDLDEHKRALKLRKRAKKKLRKQRTKQSSSNDIIPVLEQQVAYTDERNKDSPASPPTIDYVASPIDLSSLDQFGSDVVQQFNTIFANFGRDTKHSPPKKKSKKKPTSMAPIEQPSEESALSRRQRKAAQRYTLDELKALATVPDVVEACDTSAKDPLLLVDLKSYRNTVPVPQHWSQRQNYLYRYRSDEKPPFELPGFIKDTGIMEVRDNLKMQEQKKRQKAKTRERRKPKLGKMDLEYQALHDAFFRFQTEPRLTRHGDLYFERKEAVSELKSMKPGHLSDGLKEALGMLESPLAPPPWLLQMQRYGPPPNHPHLKIPGLNAPLPVGAQWGRQKNGWGQVPVDAFNRPLYGGDVFKSIVSAKEESTQATGAPAIEKTLWGELETSNSSDDEDDDDDDGDQEDDHDNDDHDDDKRTPMTTLDTEQAIPLDVGLELATKKRKRQNDPDHLPKLYDIIPSKQPSSFTGLMASEKIYNLSSISGSNHKDDVTVSLDPSSLDTYGTAVQAMYVQAQKEHQPQGAGDQSLKTMVADHARRQAKKKRHLEIRNIEKKKDFKF